LHTDTPRPARAQQLWAALTFRMCLARTLPSRRKQGHGAAPVADVLRGAGAQIAQAYEAGGAACLSVLTDARYFQGSFKFLADIRGAGVACPLLCKEFIVEAYQLFKARAHTRLCCLSSRAGPAARGAPRSPPACSKGNALALACPWPVC